MIELFNKETGEKIGELSEIQFDFLMDNIENEFLEELKYIIDPSVIILLKQRNADERIISILEDALRGKDAITMAYHIPEEAEFDYDEEE